VRSKPTLLAVFAHPDDETFRPGGMLALLARQDVRVVLLTFTRGEAGSCGDPPLCTPDELPAVREDELRCACRVLGVQPPYVLNYPDGQLQQADAEPMIAYISSLANEIHPQVWLSFGPDGVSNHPDHIAVGSWTAAAFQRLRASSTLYTVAVPHSLKEKIGLRQVNSVPDETISLSVDITPVWEIKFAAMRCHATQWSTSPMHAASEERRRIFFGREFFVRAASHKTNDNFLPYLLREHLV
jgi:LmbE family N-acetylglucosaminyl deacetylase